MRPSPNKLTVTIRSRSAALPALGDIVRGASSEEVAEDATEKSKCTLIVVVRYASGHVGFGGREGGEPKECTGCEGGDAHGEGKSQLPELERK